MRDIVTNEIRRLLSGCTRPPQLHSPMANRASMRRRSWQDEDENEDRDAASYDALDSTDSNRKDRQEFKAAKAKPNIQTMTARAPPPSGDNIYRAASLSVGGRLSKPESKSPSLTPTSANARSEFKPISSSSSREFAAQAKDNFEEIDRFGQQTSAFPLNADAKGSAGADSAPNMSSEQVKQMKKWLMRPCGRDESVVLCKVQRERSGFGLIHQIYRCYLESKHSQDRFIMSAKKLTNKQTSYYLVSLEMNPEDRGSELVLGKIRGNGVGSQYLLTDHGLPPDKTSAPSMLRKELGVFNFAFDSGGPSQIESWVPSINAAAVPLVWQTSSDSEGMEKRIALGQTAGLLKLQNKKPKWDEVHGGHVLNFQGRVNEASVKNFQLCVNDPSFDPEPVVLQFGRVGKDTFSMDVQYPLSLLQGFAICVACLDNKIADRKGYEFFKKLTSLDTAGSEDGQGSRSGSVADRLRGVLSPQFLVEKMSKSMK